MGRKVIFIVGMLLASAGVSLAQVPTFGFGNFQPQDITANTNPFSCPVGATYMDAVISGSGGGGAGGSSTNAGSGGGGGGGIECLFRCVDGPFNIVVGGGGAGGAAGSGGCTNASNGNSSTVTNSLGDFCRGTGGGGAQGATSCTTVGSAGSIQALQVSIAPAVGTGQLSRWLTTTGGAGATPNGTNTPGSGGPGASMGGIAGTLSSAGNSGANGHVFLSFPF